MTDLSAIDFVMCGTDPKTTGHAAMILHGDAMTIAIREGKSVEELQELADEWVRLRIRAAQVARSVKERASQTIDIRHLTDRPYGDDPDNLGCHLCHGRVVAVYLHVEVRSLADPPRQVEPYVRFVRWQCMWNQEHHGEFTQAVNDTAEPYQ